MADAKKCDICGKYYDTYSSIKLGDMEFMGCGLSFISEDDNILNHFDLCQECMTKVHTLFYDISCSGGRNE